MAGVFQWLCRDLHCQGAVGTAPVTLFATRRQTSLACLVFGSYLVNVDAPMNLGRSGLPVGAVGGSFMTARH